MLIGPMLPRDTGREIGGAAGNRTRVQSAYYTRVYLHSPGRSPNPFNIGGNVGERKAGEVRPSRRALAGAPQDDEEGWAL